MDYGPLTEFLGNLTYSEQQKRELYNRFEREVNLSMSKEHYSSSDLRSYITYVQQTPTGNEKGSYMTLHLGEKTARVALTKFDGDAREVLISKNFILSSLLFRCNAIPFLDHLAQCLDSFLREHNVRTTYGKLPLCLSLSYEIFSTSLEHAVVRQWPYKTDGFVGCDIGQLLNDAMRRRKLEVECVAVVNNTVGTLFSRSRWQECHMAIIVNFGTNACFLEKSEKIGRLDDEFKDKPYMVINYEWGHLGDSGILNFIRSSYDREIDNKSLYVRTKLLEKMVGIYYMEQLMTLVVLQAVREDLMLKIQHKKSLIKKLQYRKCLVIQDIYDLALDTHPHYTSARRIMANALNVHNPNEDDCRALKNIAECLVRRSATIIGTLMSYLIVRTDKPLVRVAVEGDFFRNHLHYVTYIREAINERLPEGIEYEIVVGDHGPVRGAALIIANAIPPAWGLNALKMKVINLPTRKENINKEPKYYAKCDCHK